MPVAFDSKSKFRITCFNSQQLAGKLGASLCGCPQVLLPLKKPRDAMPVAFDSKSKFRITCLIASNKLGNLGLHFVGVPKCWSPKCWSRETWGFTLWVSPSAPRPRGGKN